MTPAASTHNPVIGWDLGGVHVKAALVRDGRVEAVVQAPCALWRGLPALDETFALLPDWARAEAEHVVTMTGELTDCFAGRIDGVRQISGWAETHLVGRVRIYGGRRGLFAPAVAWSMAADIASANWHATAALTGRSVPNCLLVDIGSTTADLIPIVAGNPAAIGYSDAERLETGELVYTGVVRSHLVALTDHAPFLGRRTRLMAETFATTADVHRILGDLPEGADQQRSVDLKGKSLPESMTRLGRIVGRDLAEASPAEWRALAAHFSECQLRILHDAAAQILSRPDLDPDAPLVVCGAGRFLAERVAARLGRPALAFTDLIAGDLAEPASDWASTCGPAVAVALLAADPS